MYYLIERKDQLDRLDNFYDCFVHFISFNDNFHSKLNDISLIYIRNIDYYKGYIICIKHSESLSISKNDVFEFLKNKSNKIFVINKKDSLYYFPYPDKLYDISFILLPNLEINISCINYYYNKYFNYDKINYLIPIGKHYEKYECVFNIIKPIIQKYDENDQEYQFKNTILTDSFFYIENNGIKIDKNAFIKYFSNKITYPEFNIKEGKIYTHYNLYTLTGRPSNTFNNINFSSLNKENGEREILTVENDELIELDINAYHPQLIAELINYNLPQTSNIYETLNIQKEEMFQNIYGTIYKNHPFLNKIKEYITENNFSSQKEFNHLIQKIETHKNAQIIYNIKEYLKNKKTKLVLYVYDSFLFDYSMQDGDIIKDIQNIIKYSTKIKTGINYHNLSKK